MKKTLTALMLCFVSICFVGCSDYNAPTSSALNAASSNCNVTITASYIYSQPSIVIKDKNGNQKGMGQFWGDYYVPYDGTMTITWSWTPYKSATEKVSCTIPVGSANSLEVKITTDNTSYSEYCYVYVGGSLLASWYYKDF